MHELGTVISTFDGPSTASFSFVITGKGVRKGQFVQTQTEDGLLLACVTDVTRANRYFERAESVAEYEKGAPLHANFPATDWEYVVANARALGVVSDGMVGRPVFPAAPGAKVFSAEENMLKDFLGFEEGGINLGRLEHHSISACLRLDAFLQKHLAILGISGSGKSYATSVVIEELLDRKPEAGRLAVIVVDVHGEYVGFKSGEYAARTTVIEGEDIRIALHRLAPASLAEFLPELSRSQKRSLASIVSELKREKKARGEAYGLDDVIAAVSDSDEDKKLKASLAAWLAELQGLRLFGKADRPSLEELAQPGRLCVLDLSSIDNQKKKQLIVAHFARRLFKARKKEKIPPFALFIEEAHNFAPERTAQSEALSRGPLITIAREGRKFGASLVLISQRPKHLSTTALSQCNSNLILRVTNPYDIQHIGESCEGIDKAMLDAITTLRTGEAMLVGEAVTQPVFIRIRQRRSRASGRGESLAAIARKFEEAQAKRKADVEAFL
ncbi:MAG: ATP-binding protein [Candidatus Micrarchaeia archaeon]